MMVLLALPTYPVLPPYISRPSSKTSPAEPESCSKSVEDKSTCVGSVVRKFFSLRKGQTV